MSITLPAWFLVTWLVMMAISAGLNVWIIILRREQNRLQKRGNDLLRENL